MSFQAKDVISSNIDMQSSLEERSAQEARQKRPRLFFIDHLRVVLTILVVLHHLAITYGAFGGLPGGWYYEEVTKDPPTVGLLTIFVVVNQTFFMGLFFLLSGYFTPGSYERKGAKAFLRDRLLRLGIPLLVFTFLINPVVIYIGYRMHMPFWQLLLHYGAFGVGPLWFVEALLLFDCGYALWRWLSQKWAKPAEATNKPPTLLAVGLFILALAVVAFIVRIWFPTGWWFQPLNFQIAYFPQYISLFIIGTIAARRNWFLNVPSWMGKLGLAAAFCTIIVGAICIILMGGINSFFGGLLVCFLEAILCVGMSLGLLVLFRQRFNRQGFWGKLLSREAYGVYVIHALVVTGFCVAIAGLQLYPLLKMAVAALITVPLCFGCAYLLRKLPGVRVIL
ncbi:acyltransferase [Ktedonosporobacter rubrisoli]|uniref:Acyltransferase n=1 Tax=Ktedonosporobacter rubrisoli TaxID=2509675 RepID=A0A4P6JIG5_KTERU|nr:acyltransferase [Ktedonosporobacter rubrisoli]QBD74849.1 acyltransferase [Ktedonosporobacter rubrisoli]